MAPQWKENTYGMGSDDEVNVWFSCGAASAVAAKVAIVTLGGVCKVRVLNNPVQEEHESNTRFLRVCEEWLGVKIVSVVSKKYPSASAVEVWANERAMSFPSGFAPCTKELKKRARQEYEADHLPTANVFGFTLEEKDRHNRLKDSEIVPVLPILIDNGLTKQDCFDFLLSEGLRLPEPYLLGFPNSNCLGCVKATSPSYWQLVRDYFPDVFECRAKQSRELGARLVRVKGKRIFLDELEPGVMGRELKKFDFECSGLCGEGESQQVRSQASGASLTRTDAACPHPLEDRRTTQASLK